MVIDYTVTLKYGILVDEELQTQTGTACLAIFVAF